MFTRDNDRNLKIRKVSKYFPYYYVKDGFGNYKGYDGTPLRKVYVSNPIELKDAPKEAWEKDIYFHNKYIIDNIDKFDKCPFKYCFIDIEILCGEFPEPKEAKYPVSCITIYNSFNKEIKTFYLGDYKQEKNLLEDFVKYMQEEQFDVFFAWNSSFDYDYLHNRIDNFPNKISPINKSRYGYKDIRYPAGLSIVDYLSLYRKIFKGIRSYALDYVLEHEFGKGKTHKQVDFDKLNPEIKARNIEDVKGMVKLEKKHKIIKYNDNIRRFAMITWEDLTHYSRAIDSVVLRKAKEKGVVLPSKHSGNKENFEGAFRETYSTGRFFNVSEYDLAGAYMYAIIDLCLSPENLTNKKTKDTLDINITDRKTNKIIDICTFKQNKEAILPSAIKDLMEEKNKYKKLLTDTDASSSNYSQIEKRYSAIKGLVLSGWGTVAMKGYRLYNPKVASAITSVVRDLLHYVKDKCKEKGYEVVFIDTDSVMINDGGKNIVNELNSLVQEWSQDRFNKDSSIYFEYEGTFKDGIIILAKCRYKGRLDTGHGIKDKVKGVEVKRADSTTFIKNFQDKLFDKLLDKESKINITNWIINKIKNFDKEKLEDIAFPCNLSKPIEGYVNKSIHVRALMNTKGIEKRIGELYYWVYTIPEVIDTEKEIRYYYKQYRIDEQTIKDVKELYKAIKDKATINFKGQDIMAKSFLDSIKEKEYVNKETNNVKAFDSDNKTIDKKEIDWNKMIERNILNKVEVIYNAMGWENELNKIKEVA